MSGEYAATRRKIPPGVSTIRSIRGKDWSFETHRYVILFVTFIAYACYHASRKPSSIVKSVLDPEHVKNVTTFLHHPWPVGEIFIKRDGIIEQNGLMDGEFSQKKGWKPFNGVDGTSKLGEIDVAFLACYSMGMYVAGHLGDTLDLRLFLTTGMIGSGIFVALFGMGFFWNIHAFWFYLVMQMLAGLCQSTGWPSVVAIVGNWFGKRKRGLIMGIWNAHTSIGNITGSLLAAAVLDFGWGWSFIAPGLLIILGGIIVYLFLVPYPEDLGFPCPNSLNLEVSDAPNDVESQNLKEKEKVQRSKVAGGQVGKVSSHNGSSANRTSVGLLEACLIPGVIPFALCLFFAKLVAYTFLYWLPFYLSQTAINGQYMSVKSAGNLSTLFDVGGIVGGILAGYISDKSRARATTAATFMYAAIPAMLLYRSYGGISETWNIVLMMVAGLFVNGPYALITTAVSADLGTHSSIRGDSRALATVTAIIDGTGSIGAALGPLLTGFLSTKGWDAVFAMLVVCALAAGLLLTRLVIGELTEKLYKRRCVEQHNVGGNTSFHGDSTSAPLLAEQRR